MLLTQWMATLLMVISLTTHSVKSDSHVIVIPTDSDSSLCGDHAVCDTLSNLILNNSGIFSSDSNLKLEFLKGIHTVTTSSRERLKVEGKRSVYWYGNDAVIICETVFGFMFTDINKLEITQLTFSKCGSMLDGASNGLRNMSAALFLNNVQSFYSEEVQVNLSSGYGLLVYNLYGEAHINESLFQDNNVNCSEENPLSHDQCVGGNIALHFYTRVRTLNTSVQVCITDSIIQGGSDRSETVSSCEGRMENPSSSSALKANGLAVVFAQENYQVKLHIHGTTFFNNTGHPAVLVHDYSARSNIVEIYDSYFESFGDTLLSSIIKSSEEYDNDMVMLPDVIWTLRNCSFRNNDTRSHGTKLGLYGMYICIKPAGVSNTHFQKITIVDCNFNGYVQQYTAYIPTAFIKVWYDFSNDNSFPSTLIEMEGCRVLSNYDKSMEFQFTDDQFLDNIKLQSSIKSIITIKHSVFNRTVDRFHSVIEIYGPQDGTILWKYQRRNISLVGFSNSSFVTSPVRVTNANIILRDCNFTKSRDTAVRGYNSVIIVDGQNLMRNNRGYDGGALSLDESILLLMPNSQTIISGNSATYGGGIFATPVEPDLSKAGIGVYSFCTITRLASNRYPTQSITFKKNHALSSGHSIFGGKYVNCTYYCTGKSQCHIIPDTNKFDSQHLPQYISITPYSNDSNPFTEVSSPANRICLCESNEPTNRCVHTVMTLFAGQVFNISLIALGELNGSTTVVVRLSTIGTSNNKMVDVEGNRRPQVLSAETCTPIRYLILKSTNSQSNFQAFNYLKISEETPEIARSKYPHRFVVLVNLFQSCPPGLKLSSSSQKCECLPFFERHNIGCYKSNAKIQIVARQWIGYYDNSHLKLVVTNGYPLNYLTSGDGNINLNKPEEQCINNRTGVLCGACQTDLSIVLGTSNCKKCSNVYLLLIIPFALAGVALVVLLLKCNLTVSVGHINGIIFYANIVQVNKAILFPNRKVPYQIFSTFIAWLNLDLGVETCFFENMDSYAKVWLQFVFPVYVWMLISLIIMLAKYSNKLSKLIGSNSVPVLATLLLLSYAKLFRTLIESVAFNLKMSLA